MGYETVFRPSRERMEKFKPYMDMVSITKYKTLTELKITVLCMRDVSEDEYDSFQMKLSYLVDELDNLCRQESKAFVYETSKNDENGEFWFCGWKYSNSECEYYEDVEKADLIKELSIIAADVKKPDWFERNEDFYTLLNHITDRINGFEDAISEIADYEIMKEFDDVRDLDDDSENESLNDVCNGVDSL